MFQEIRERLGTPDVSLLPVGTYEPRWFMHPQHMNPDDAVRAHIDLGSHRSLGMHFGTFHLSDEAIEAPLLELDEALARHRASNFQVPRFGETFAL
jgi:L-ascorbate metabolism protein UlaG (beta-lactamase superfamily)